MTLYIDIENIRSFIANRTHELYADCIKTMQKQLDVQFNFNKEVLTADEGLLAWFKIFTEGAGKTNTFSFSEEKFPIRPLKSNTHTTLNPKQLSSIFLLEDEKIHNCINAGALLIGRPGEEFLIFNQIFFNQGDYKFDKKIKIGGTAFSKWTDLDKYSLPLSDIVIIDPYILVDNSMIDTNLITYLKTLVLRAKCKINVVLYVNSNKVAISYADLSSKIRQAIKSVTGISPDFTLVKYFDQRNVPSVAEHDRTIYTNYFRVYSGDSFNYFLSTGKKNTKGREIHYISFGERENYQLAVDLISDVQKSIDSLPSTAIEGDKKSNLLNFK